MIRVSPKRFLLLMMVMSLLFLNKIALSQAPTPPSNSTVTGTSNTQAPAAPRVSTSESRTEIYLGKEIKITTHYVNIAPGEKRQIKIDHKVGSYRFENIRSEAFKFQTPTDSNNLVSIEGGAKQASGELILFNGDSLDTSTRGSRFLVFVNPGTQAPELSRQLEVLKTLVGDLEGLEIKVVGDNIVLDGEMLIPSDCAKLGSVIQQLQYKNIIALVDWGPQALELIAKKITEELRDVNITVRVFNKQIIIEGNVESAMVADRYKQTALLFVPDRCVRPVEGGGQGFALEVPKQKPVLNMMLTVSPPAGPQGEAEKMIRITVNYVEIDSDYLNSFQFRWAPAVTPSAGIGYGKNAPEGLTPPVPDGFGAYIGLVVDSLFPKLISDRSHGHSRILKSANMLVRQSTQSSGSSSASLESSLSIPFTRFEPNPTPGGQPIPVNGLQNVSNRISVNAGIAPGKNSEGKTVVDFKSLELVFNQTLGDSQPAPQTNNTIKTSILVPDGDTVAVGGVLQDNQRAEYNKDKPTGSGQPLFKLQRSKSYNKSNSQFVIFLTPKVVDDLKEGTEEIKRKFRLKRNITGED